MFLIEDGRKEFYQWDVDRRLIIEDGTITQVHFCNRTDNCSLVVEVYVEGDKFYADVPNLLLQTSWDIRVYAVNSNYTKFCETYNVIARTKPADYVYTETEVIRWEELEAEMAALSDAVADINLEGYATKVYVDEAVANVDVPDVDLSDYYTKEETDAAIASSGGGSDTTIIYLDGTSKQDLSYFNGITESNAKDYIDNCVMYMNGYLCLYIEFEKSSTASKNKLKFGYIENVSGTYYLKAFYVEQTSKGYNNSMAIKSYAYSNDFMMTVNNIKDYSRSWVWYDATEYTYVPVSYAGNATSHIKVVCYCNDDTNHIIEFDVSATYNNSFHEEWGTKYYVPNLIPNNDSPIYFENSGGVLNLKNEAGDDILQNGTIKLLGFHYWY